MVETPHEVRVSAAIPAVLHAQIQSVRAKLSINGTPDGGPSMSAIVRQALEEWYAARSSAHQGKAVKSNTHTKRGREPWVTLSSLY